MNAQLPIPGQPVIKTLEIITHVAPLGLRFWDTVTNSFVGSGLHVTAYPVGNPHRPITAIATRTAVYAFHHLPGLRDQQNGAGDDAYWQTITPHVRHYQIDVIDLEGRFLPASFTASAPTRGVATLLCGSPPLPFTLDSPFTSPLNSPPGVIDAIPLFSAPNRAIPAGMAVIRGQFWDSANNREAAWAMVEAAPPGQPLARGITDTKGRLTLIFPYPAPNAPAVGGSPSNAPRAPLWEESWTLPLRAYYGALDAPALCDILQQPAATLWADTSPPIALTETQLRAGLETILRGTDAATIIITAP